MVPMTTILAHDASVLPGADLFVQTHSTNPFLRTETVDTAISAFLSGQPAHDSLFSVVARRVRLYDRTCPRPRRLSRPACALLTSALSSLCFPQSWGAP